MEIEITWPTHFTVNGEQFPITETVLSAPLASLPAEERDLIFKQAILEAANGSSL